MDEIVLESGGEEGKTTLLIEQGNYMKDSTMQLVTRYAGKKKEKEWTVKELVDLLNDGMRYRLLKKSKKLK